VGCWWAAVLCAVQLSLLYGRELAKSYALYGRPAHHRLCDWATDWPDDLGVIDLAYASLEPALGLAGLALFVGGALVWNRQAERQQQLQ
jgi:hypothetical protein